MQTSTLPYYDYSSVYSSLFPLFSVAQFTHESFCIVSHQFYLLTQHLKGAKWKRLQITSGKWAHHDIIYFFTNNRWVDDNAADCSCRSQSLDTLQSEESPVKKRARICTFI